jgi:hypothetical protein
MNPMRLIAALLVGLGLFFAWASPAMADTILAPGSDWEYTFSDPTADLTWNTTTGTAGWLTGPAPFGNNTGGYTPGDPLGLFDWATFWDDDGRDGDDLWVRAEFDLTGFDIGSVGWDLGVDNGFKLYINGTLVGSGNAEGYTSQWEYSGSVSPAYLFAGVNIVAVALEDHGGLTAFDMQITASPVPEPSTLALLGLGLAGLGLARRRRKKAIAA